MSINNDEKISNRIASLNLALDRGEINCGEWDKGIDEIDNNYKYIIRCRDCKHYQPMFPEDIGIYMCTNKRLPIVRIDENFYCAYGEAKEVEK